LLLVAFAINVTDVHDGFLLTLPSLLHWPLVIPGTLLESSRINMVAEDVDTEPKTVEKRHRLPFYDLTETWTEGRDAGPHCGPRGDSLLAPGLEGDILLAPRRGQLPERRPWRATPMTAGPEGPIADPKEGATTMKNCSSDSRA
jgi:hypothetical protein